MLQVYLYTLDIPSMKLCLEEGFREGVNYTVDIIKDVVGQDKEEDVEWYFLVGEDKLFLLDIMRDFEHILELISGFLVMCCPTCGRGKGYWENNFPPYLNEGNCILFDNPECPHISSKDIRQTLHHGRYDDEEVKTLLHPDVLQCIENHDLYYYRKML